MDVHASPAELPELQDFLGAFQGRFRRPEGADALERYVTGLLSELPTKNGDPMAQAVPGTREQRRQEFLTNMPWAAADLNRQRVEKMMAEVTLGDGVWVLDDTGVPTQGKTAVGGARQYSGTLGKVGTGPLAVTCGDTELQAMGPVAVRLSLPHAWAEDLERRGTARVPEEVTFQTNPEMAVARLDQARAWGVPHRCVVADAGSGAPPHVLATLDARQARDVLGVCTDCRVSDQRQATSPGHRVDQRLQALPRWPWRTSRGRQGSQGWLRKKFVAVRCWRVTREGQRSVGWRLGERATRGQPEEWQDYWRHRSASATVDEWAG